MQTVNVGQLFAASKDSFFGQRLSTIKGFAEVSRGVGTVLSVLTSPFVITMVVPVP